MASNDSDEQMYATDLELDLCAPTKSASYFQGSRGALVLHKSQVVVIDLSLSCGRRCLFHSQRLSFSIILS